MQVETRIQRRYLAWNVAYAVICAALGAWGAWDYWVTIPNRETAVAEYLAAVATRDELVTIRTSRSLTGEEVGRYEAAEATLARYALSVPVAPPNYDRPLQFWVYFVGCGVLGTPWVLWLLISARSQRFSLEDDGTVNTPQGPITADHITGIDMSKWMSKSVAVLEVDDGRRVRLDDYIHSGMHLIVGEIAHRFHPEIWTTNAREVEKVAEEERAAALAEQEAAADADSDNPNGNA